MLGLCDCLLCQGVPDIDAFFPDDLFFAVNVGQNGLGER